MHSYKIDTLLIILISTKKTSVSADARTQNICTIQRSVTVTLFKLYRWE